MSGLRKLRTHAKGLRMMSWAATIVTVAACQNSTPLPVALADAGADAGDAADGSVPLSLCPVPTVHDATPFTVNFQFQNSGPKSLFLRTDCGRTEFGTSSCDTGFAEVIEGPAPCPTCDCTDTQCMPVACGPCAPPAALEVTANGQSKAEWRATAILLSTKITRGQRAGMSCTRSANLPAGRYRVAVRVFDKADDAARGVGGRIVTTDFDLALKSQNVPVAIAVDGAGCEPTAGASLQVCSERSTRAEACSLSQGLTFAWEGGNAPSFDSFEIEAPHTLVVVRHFGRGPAGQDQTCRADFPVCSLDARVVTTGDLTRALAQPGVANSFEATTPVFGLDDRPVDGSILIVRRADGTSLGIGGACNPPDSLCARSLKPGMADLESLLWRLREQLFQTTQCEKLSP